MHIFPISWLSALALGAALLLPGCASLSKDECRHGDWYQIGLRDGAAGLPARRIVKHRDACAEYRVEPDDKKYRAGREEGLREYCQLRNAFKTGLDGHKYEGVCPPAIDTTYRRYNFVAFEVYRLRKEIETIEDRIYDKERLLDEKKERKLTADERDRLRDEIRELDRRRDRLRDDLRRADYELDKMMDDLRHNSRDLR